MNSGRKFPPHAPNVSQPKAAAPASRQPPTAPPVYRPQPTPRVLQTKAAAGVPAANQTARTPAAPPVYNPRQTPACLQRKPAVVQTRPATTAEARAVKPPTPAHTHRPAPAPPRPAPTPSNAGTIQLVKHLKTTKIERPKGFTAAARQSAFITHNLSNYGTKIKDFKKPDLPSINAAMPHRMCWNDIGINTAKFFDMKETESDFRRWTRRFTKAGVEKMDETEEEISSTQRRVKDVAGDIEDLEDELSDTIDKNEEVKLKGKILKKRESQKELEERVRQLKSLLTKQRTSQGKFVSTRTKFVDKMDDYREKWNEWKLDETNQKAKSGMKEAREEAESAMEDFVKAANSFHANVPDLGPHFGVNNPVRERTHLNFRESRTKPKPDSRGRTKKRKRSLSPMSRRVVDMSPGRIAELAVDKGDRIISVSGHAIKRKKLTGKTRNRLSRHETKEIKSYDPQKAWALNS